MSRPLKKNRPRTKTKSPEDKHGIPGEMLGGKRAQRMSNRKIRRVTNRRNRTAMRMQEQLAGEEDHLSLSKLVQDEILETHNNEKTLTT